MSMGRKKIVFGLLVGYAFAATAVLVAFHGRLQRLDEDEVARAAKDMATHKRQLDYWKRQAGWMRREEGQQKPTDRLGSGPPPAPVAGDPPAGSSDPSVPDVVKRTRDLFEAYLAAEETGDTNAMSERGRELMNVIMYTPRAHTALMQLLRAADSEDRIDAILGFLTRNTFVGSCTDSEVTKEIHMAGWEIARGGGSAKKRASAVEVLLNYPGRYAGKENASAVVDLMSRESDPTVKGAIFESLIAYGPYPLPEEKRHDVIQQFRSRAQAGDYDIAAIISRWSEDPNDFQFLTLALRTVQDGGAKQALLNAFQGNRAITRGRERESRAVLVEVMNAQTENPGLRRMAYDFLQETWLPLDAETEMWTRRYEAEVRR